MIPPIDESIRASLVARCNEGESVREVADDLGVSLTTAYRWIHYAARGGSRAMLRWSRDFAALKLEAQQRLQRGEPASAVADALGVALSTVYRWRCELR